MYGHPAFRDADPDRARDLIQAHPLGTLVSYSADVGLTASPAPFLVGEELELSTHFPRANPQLESLRDGVSVLVSFSGREAYISPSYYASKAEHGKVVPTWNYEVVPVHGRVELIDDPAWLRRHLEDMTDTFEGGRADPWRVEDAPKAFTEQLIAALVGLRIHPERVEAKWKLSQNRSEADRRSVIEALRASPEPRDRAMADAVAEG